MCYNRFRYYHPDSGCYLSPDPLGLMGGLNTHAYVPNPTGWVDPLGLAKCPDLTLGEGGRIESARATVSPSDLRTGTSVNDSARTAARAMGNETDDAGHILAKVLGGQGGKGNVFPQLSNINRGQYREFEKEVMKHVQQNGPVDINWTFKYRNGGTRPTDIIYNVSQNGKTVLYSIFGN